MRKTALWIAEFLMLMLAIAWPQAPVGAQETSKQEWHVDKLRLESLDSDNLTGEERCQATWNILWPHIKSGVPEAKVWLSFLLLPLPHGDAITLPGRYSNSDNLRDGITVIANTLGDELDDHKEPSGGLSLKEAFYGHALVYLSDEALNEAFPDRKLRQFQDEKFLRCLAIKGILDEPIRDCAESAIEAGIIPSFDGFVAKIDSLLATNNKPTCVFHQTNSIMSNQLNNKKDEQ